MLTVLKLAAKDHSNAHQDARGTSASAATRRTESRRPNPEDIFSAQAPDPKLRRLFDVYDQARADFFAVVDFGDTRTLTAAKFLRDTAENALNILRDEVVDTNILSELRETCTKASSTVVTLSGGKVRKFDESGGDTERHLGGVDDSDHGIKSEVAEDPGDRNMGNELGFRRGFGRGYGRGYERGHEGEFSRGQGGRRDIRGPGRGRGHSGVPFGYSRVVDSYHPYGARAARSGG